MKALKVTISGSYKTAQNDIVDFEDVVGFVPFVDDEHASMHVRRRYANAWVKGWLNDDDTKVYPERIEKMRQVFIDDIEEVERGFDYVGKDIKKMTYDELQDLATAKDLRYIPLPKSQSGFDIRDARVRAYVDYSGKVMGEHINENDEDFNFAKLPELIVDGEIREELSQKVTNDEIIAQEMKPQMNNETPKESLTLEDLKDIADKKKIKYHWNIGRDKLYTQLFGGSV